MDVWVQSVSFTPWAPLVHQGPFVRDVDTRRDGDTVFFFFFFFLAGVKV